MLISCPIAQLMHIDSEFIRLLRAPEDACLQCRREYLWKQGENIDFHFFAMGSAMGGSDAMVPFGDFLCKLIKASLCRQRQSKPPYASGALSGDSGGSISSRITFRFACMPAV